MSSRLQIHFLTALMTAGLLTMVACERRDLEQYYDNTETVRLAIDWESRFGIRPQGMTIMVADVDSDTPFYRDVTNHVDGVTLQLAPGTYKMMAFNRTFEEYGSIAFYDRDSYTGIYALCQPRRAGQGRSDDGDGFFQEPEAIGVAVDTFTVMPGSDDFTFIDYRDAKDGEALMETFTETVLPMTTQLDIYVHVVGYPYVTDLTGSITGLADGFRLSQLWRTDGEVAYELNNWKLNVDTDSTAWMHTSVRTFGLPHGRELLSQRHADDNVVSLKFYVADGTVYECHFDVGKQIRYEEDFQQFGRMDVTLRLELWLDQDIVVPHDDSLPPPTSAGFDADVDPWEEGGTTVVTF